MPFAKKIFNAHQRDGKNITAHSNVFKGRGEEEPPEVDRGGGQEKEAVSGSALGTRKDNKVLICRRKTIRTGGMGERGGKIP